MPHPPSCQPIARTRFVARGPGDVAPTLDGAVDAAVRAAGGPLDVEHRAPLDLLILIDGHSSFMGSKQSAYDAVRTALDEVGPHIPEHSLIRIAKMSGDTVTLLGHGEYPYIPLARTILGEASSYDDNGHLPRYSVALERARHLLDARHDRTRALLVIGNACTPPDMDDFDAIERELRALRSDGVKIAIVQHLTADKAFHGCRELRDDSDADHHDTTDASAIPGLVFDAVEDFSRPDPGAPPADLLHFVHDTLSAP
jgi:hypothetical protein